MKFTVLGSHTPFTPAFNLVEPVFAPEGRLNLARYFSAALTSAVPPGRRQHRKIVGKAQCLIAGLLSIAPPGQRGINFFRRFSRLI